VGLSRGGGVRLGAPNRRYAIETNDFRRYVRDAWLCFLGTRPAVKVEVEVDMGDEDPRAVPVRASFADKVAGRRITVMQRLKIRLRGRSQS
jgi:hypothetical protein